MNAFTRTLLLPLIGLFEALTPFRTRSETTQIVPQASISGRALFVVITIMSFLASLTAASVYMVNQSANTWFNDIASEVTVQVNVVDGQNMERRVRKVSAFLKRQPGIAGIFPLTIADSASLLEPWLGKSDALKELPIPRLIAVTIDSRAPANLRQLGRRLATEFDKVKLDDHRQWQNQIRKMTSSLAIIGMAILFFVALATFAVVLSATRAAMAANRDIIEVLHFVGAKQHFIAHEFEKHFLVMGIRAGLFGAAMAALSFIFMPSFMNFMGGSQGRATGEYQQLFGSVSLNSSGYLILVAIVLSVSAICMFTSRYWVDRILKQEGTVANPVQARARTKKDKADRDSITNPYSAPDSGAKRPVLVSAMRFLSFSAMAVAGLVLFGFFLFVFALDKNPQPPRQGVDGIVALTGDNNRISEAVRLLAAGKAKRLLISGVYSRTRKKQLMRYSPASVPLFNCCIDIGRKAKNTAGNAIESRHWAKSNRFTSLLLVTSNYHVPRALLLARQEMPDIRLSAFAVQPNSFRNGTWWRSSGTLSLLFQEYLKYVSTLARLKNS